MIKIHSTKKLLAKLPLDTSGTLPNPQVDPEHLSNSDSLLGDWHANLLILQRVNCVLFVHDATRFPVFVKELRKPDFAKLAWHFEDGFMNTLLKAGASNTQMKAAANALRPLQFDNDCNRSVQGTMNQMAGETEHMLWYDNASVKDISAYRTGVCLADRPTSMKGVKGFIWPDKEMLALLDRIAETGLENDSGKMDRDNVVRLDLYRAD